MKVKPKKVCVSSSQSSRGPAVLGRRDTGWTNSPAVTQILKRLPDQPTRFVAQAPGRLDVMGGLSDYTGSLVLNTTTGGHVCVVVQRRTDNDLSIISVRSPVAEDVASTVVAMSQLYGPNGSLIDARHGRSLAGEGKKDVARCIVGALVEILRVAATPRLDGGLSVVVGSETKEPASPGWDVAVVAAALVAVAGACDVTLDPLEAAAVCQRVENEWLGIPAGVGDAVCVLLGEPNTLAEVRCEPCALSGSIRLPDDLVLVGIDCGMRHPEANLKYSRVRTAAFMGRALIDRIIRHDGSGRLQWDGHLARVSVTDYVGRFRDRIPTKLKGSEYLERFGETGDPLTRIDPEFVYKIRSRTEHHIYEHTRACQFVECLSRAIRSGENRALEEAGELMYASHWSYGQRCGLGSVETDMLVSLIRGHGTDAEIYGAKITGRGCGGSVAVLMRATERARAAVDDTIKRYQSKTGRVATLLRGSLPGALVSGAQRM